MMTDSVARNFQLLFDFVCDDDARFAIRWALLSLVDDNFVFNGQIGQLLTVTLRILGQKPSESTNLHRG